MILALLILGAIAGCDRKKDARTESPPDAPDDQKVARVVDHTPTEASQANAQAPADPPTMASSTGKDVGDGEPDAIGQGEQRPAEELFRARHELHSLAEGAVRLRAALLHADFRADPNNPSAEGTGRDAR
jgi:hypothetical protein